jgi:ankyrin repeat protein
MLRKLFIILSPEKSYSNQETLEDLLPSLTKEQQIIVKQISEKTFPIQPCPPDSKEYKTFNSQIYQSLYPYLLLAYSFEKNGTAIVHAKKLACIFDNSKEALRYLKAYGENYPDIKNFVHDACLFQLPASSSPHLKEWINLAKNIKNLLDHKFVLLLNSSTTIDEQIKLDKSEKNKLLLNVVNKYSESKEPLTVVEPTQCLVLKENLRKIISEKHQFCRLYASKHHEMSQDKKNQEKNSQYLKELRELHSNLAILHLTKKIGQYGIHDLYDVHQRALMLTAPEKEIFIKNGISEKYFNIFKNIDRNQAGKNIPDIGILSCDEGFYLKKLIVSNPNEGAIAACLGKLTDCCQSLSGELGEPCTLHGLTHPDSGFYVLFKGNPNQPKLTDEICAQTWVLRTLSGSLLFDSIESRPSMIKKFLTIQKNAFRHLANVLIDDHNVSRVVCGATSGITDKIGFSVNYGNCLESPKEYEGYRDSYEQLLLADRRFLGILKNDNTIQLDPKKIQSALAESQKKFSEELRFTIGYLLQNKISASTLLKHASNKIKKRIKNYIKIQLEFIALAKEYIYSSNNKENKLIKFIKNRTIDFNFTFDNEPIFMWAVKKNDIIFLKKLRKLNLFDINFQNFQGKTALHLSASKKIDKSVTQFLINSKANVNMRYKNNTTALMLAAWKKESDTVKALLDANADVNFVNEENHTALTYAARADSQENIRLLIEAKADVKNKFPLKYAVENNSLASVTMLLDAKASINEKKMGLKETALIWAAKEGYASIVKILLEKKSEIDIQDSIFKRTALMQAIAEDKIETVKILIEAKANVEIRDYNENTAVDIAEMSNKIRILNKPYCRFFCLYAKTILFEGSIPKIISLRKNTI